MLIMVGGMTGLFFLAAATAIVEVSCTVRVYILLPCGNVRIDATGTHLSPTAVPGGARPDAVIGYWLSRA